MKIFDLGGQWHVKKQEDYGTIPATVPGCIHMDLLHAEKIEDPFYRDNEARQMWIGETDWMYSRTFTLDSSWLDHQQILLQCLGLDTLATIVINGAEIGKTDNQFRTWEFDVKPYLKAGGKHHRDSFCHYHAHDSG
jgi:beta-mannosidase